MGPASHEGRQVVSGEALVQDESPALFICFGTKSAPLRENDSRASVREIGLDVNVTVVSKSPMACLLTCTHGSREVRNMSGS